MKSLLIAIKPKWCAKIMNGIKTIEVRKNKALAKAIQKLIDEYGYADIYVYCCKNEWLLYDKEQKIYFSTTIKKGCLERHGIDCEYVNNLEYELFVCEHLEGKVIFKFRCYKVEEFPYISGEYDKLIGSCLSEKELLDYSTINFENGIRFVKTIYAIHISDLEIFDKPKELSEFYKVGHYEDLDDCFTDEKQINGKWCIPLKKAPQNMVYIEIEE